MHTHQLNEYLAIAVPFAKESGAEIIAAYEERSFEVGTKPDGTRVSNFEQMINERFITLVENNQKLRGHSVVGEESSLGSRDASHRWFIDPLDGTHRFLDVINRERETGKPEAIERLSCGIAIAKEYEGELEVAVFYNPFPRRRGALYIAAAGLGATLNGRSITTRHQDFGPGMNYDYCYWPGAKPDARVLQQAIGTPLLDRGSATHQACEVASGESAFSVFPGHSSKTIHDMMAGMLIAREAGATVTDLNGQRPSLREEWHGAIYASDPDTHARVMEIMQTA